VRILLVKQGRISKAAAQKGCPILSSCSFDERVGEQSAILSKTKDLLETASPLN
jgi:hypothetical protein